jgi:MFS family permease
MAYSTAASPIAKSMQAPAPTPAAAKAVLSILAAVSFCHLLNDMVQSLLPSIYPILKSSFHLNFGQVGLLTLTYQIVASLLQPLIGLYTDRRPMPYALAVGMCFTLTGIVMLALAPTYSLLLLASAVIGAGSAIFHPESSRIARIASGGQHGFASLFFRWEAIPAARSARCWPHLSCFRWASAEWHGFRLPPWQALSSFTAWAAGAHIIWHARRPAMRMPLTARLFLIARWFAPSWC